MATKKKRYKFVNLEDNLGDVANEYAVAARIMLDYGLHCVGCFANRFDTVENGALLHGMTEKEIHEMLQDVNAAIAGNEEKK